MPTCDICQEIVSNLPGHKGSMHRPQLICHQVTLTRGSDNFFSCVFCDERSQVYSSMQNHLRRTHSNMLSIEVGLAGQKPRQALNSSRRTPYPPRNPTAGGTSMQARSIRGSQSQAKQELEDFATNLFTMTQRVSEILISRTRDI
jgi:hypothetical protein